MRSMIFRNKCITVCAYLIKKCIGPGLNRHPSFYMAHSCVPAKQIISMDASYNVPFSSASVNTQYEKAIIALNGLQSNAETLEKIRNLSLDERRGKNCQNLKIIQNYLARVGVPLSDLDRLSIIHISGTKGKGSTCAFVESILRGQGFKTGFFSSPHLVSARERIRINSFPIPKEKFSYYFWDIYSKLSSCKENENDMPAYFQFITILAFNVFLREDVDVAIMEVGIGGEYDCTNVVRKPVVCGITSLDIDHTAILGATIEEIAWHKAGIIKSGVPAFTVSRQPAKGLEVMLQRAKDKNSELIVAPSLESYGWRGKPIHLGLSGFVQFLNASLALQVSHYWIEQKGKKGSVESKQYGMPFELSEEEITCLSNVVWPGRSQVLDTDIATFFLDGAHTCSSIQNCTEWFHNASMQLENEKGGNVCKVLVFNLTGERDCESMLEILYPCNFDLVIFTTNLVSKNMPASSDQTNYTVSEAAQIARCSKLQNIWLKLFSQDNLTDNLSIVSTSTECVAESSPGNELAGSSKVANDRNLINCPQNSQRKDVSSYCKTFMCIKDVLTYLSRDSKLCSENISSKESLQAVKQVHVLVTGSLHLVGGFLALLDPNLSLPNQSHCPIKMSLAEFAK